MNHCASRCLYAAVAAIALVLSGACASTGATPRPFPLSGPDLVAGTTPEPPPIDQRALLDTALRLRGVPYRNGGSGLSGFDCSGFTQYVFARHGLSLPREVRSQFKVGTRVSQRQLRQGDLVFFSTTARGPTHVAIAMGGGEFIHAPSSEGVVRIERIDSRYWASRLVAIRRVVPR